MENKGIRILLVVALSTVLLATAFLAGGCVGYFTPSLFDVDASVSGPVTCPPCPEAVTRPFLEGQSDDDLIQCPECPYLDPSGNTPEEYQDLFAPFWETWDIIHEEYLEQPVDDLALMRGAIDGMLNSLGDDYTFYMTPDEYKQANESMEGEYQGIGAWVDTSGDYVEVISPMKGAPADEAGLLPKDLVIAIDGEDMTGIPGDLVLQRILGPAGTDVTLTILRGEETFDVTITRANIVVPTVESEMLEGNIAYVALLDFGGNSTEQLRKALRELLRQDPVGLVFDLRNNGGGYLNTAIQVVSEFIPEGVVMYEQYGDGKTLKYQAIPGGLATEIPMVVLVNEGTASASEITAGAIQDYNRAPLIGVTTFGKGLVQSWIALEDDAGAVRVTIAQWLTPDGRQIGNEGLKPEYEVEMTEEDYAAGNDPQLDKALEVLKEMIQENS